jgi:hypothetical protein
MNTLPKELVSDGKSSSGFSSAWWSIEEHVRAVSSLESVGEDTNHLFLVSHVLNLLRPVFLNPWL